MYNIGAEKAVIKTYFVGRGGIGEGVAYYFFAGGFAKDDAVVEIGFEGSFGVGEVLGLANGNAVFEQTNWVAVVDVLATKIGKSVVCELVVARQGELEVIDSARKYHAVGHGDVGAEALYAVPSHVANDGVFYGALLS